MFVRVIYLFTYVYVYMYAHKVRAVPTKSKRGRRIPGAGITGDREPENQTQILQKSNGYS